MKQLFRLELDENGQANTIDFTRHADAMIAFQAAKKRKGVYSARIDLYDAETYEKQTMVVQFERP